jgi:hypothetical protein
MLLFTHRKARSLRPVVVTAIVGATVDLLLPLSAKAQTIVNSGFETPVQGSGFTYGPTGAGIGWTFNGNSGISGNSSAFTSGNAAAPEGVQVAFLQNGASVFSQSISGFAAGSFNVSFFATQRQTGGGTEPSTQAIRLAFDGTPFGTFTPTPNNPAYQFFASSNVALTAGSHTLSFSGTNPASAADVTAFVDKVQINAVSAPEPGALALLAASALPFAGLLRRRVCRTR